MKIFISWGGSKSKAIAEVLRDWIKLVLQAMRPWMSTRDIDRGAIWLTEIMDQLKDTEVGIVCLTQENKNRPWVLFEAGALVKGLTSNRVCTLLIDLQPTDVEDPLAQFNHTLPTKEGMLSFIRTLNARLGEAGLDERALERSFTTFWPQFEQDFHAAIESNPVTETLEPRSEKEILVEILQNSRSLHQRLAALSAKKAGEASLLRVLGAQYGAGEKFHEVTDLLNDRVAGGRLELLVCNENMGGDPALLTEKQLSVEYWYSGKRLSKTVKEGEMLILP